MPEGWVTSLTPYSESLERVRSVLVFFAASAANSAVLAELESEVRVAVAAARNALLPMEDVQSDLDRLATITLPASAAASASRLMKGWAAMAFERPKPGRAPGEPDELRS
jgi:hypothetical protein